MANGIIEYLNNSLILRRYEFGYGASISAGAAKRVYPADAGYIFPEGYYPVGITHFSTGSGNLVLDYLQLQNSAPNQTYFLAVKNVHSSSSVGTSAKAALEVLFAPEWMVEIIDADEPTKQNGDILIEPVFKIKNFTCAYTSLAANTGAKAFTRANMNFFVPEGYEIFSLRNFGSGAYRVSVSDIDPFSTNRMMTIRNTYTSAVSSTVDMGVVFINRKFMTPDTRKGLILRCNKSKFYDDTYYGYDNYSIAAYRNDTMIGRKQFRNMNPYNNYTQPEPGSWFYNNELRFFCDYSIDGENFGIAYPVKVEVISGGEYIQFIDSSCYKFIITEDLTDKQVILNFTFE